MIARSFAAVAAVLFLASLVSAEDAGKWKPGMHPAVPTSDGFNIDLFIPDTYAEQTERKFPVLYMHSWNGKPKLKPFQDWANRTGMILIGINEAKNGPNPPIVARQDAAIAFIEKELRISDCLRFSMGMSGAAMMSWLLCINHPDNHAGILMMGQSGFPELPPKHVAVAYIHGTKEQNLPFINMIYKQLERAGNPLRRIVRPGGHIDGTHEDKEEMLTWMVTLERFTHPRRSPAEMKEAKDSAVKRIEGLASIGDASERFKEAETLLAIPGIERWPEAKPLATAWLKAALAKAEGISDPIEKHDLLTTVSLQPHLKRIPSAERKPLTTTLTELRKDPAVKKEYMAGQVLQKVVALEARARSKANWRQVLVGYTTVKARYAGTRAAAKAEEGARRAEKHLQ